MPKFLQTQNSILRISDEKTLQLIECYEQEECLWNTSSVDYKNRHKRQKAYERIARKLDLQNFEARHVVIKFKNLRNSYCQELKKIASSISMGLSEEEQYKPRVFWFPKMDTFLRPYLQPARAQVTYIPAAQLEQEREKVKKELVSDSDLEQNSDEDFCIPEDSVSSCPAASADAGDSVNSEDCQQPPVKRRAVREPSPARTKEDLHNYSRNENTRYLEVLPMSPRADLAKTVRSLEAKVQALTEEKKEDYYDSFGKYIASLLRSMPKERAMLLQPQVIGLVVSGSGFGEGSSSQPDGNDM